MCEYDYIVLDRWSLSALIYGMATGLGRADCEDQFAALIRPDATIVLVGKALSDKKDDVYEADTYIQRRVRELYTDWAINNTHNGGRMIHASGNRGEVHLNVLDALRHIGVL
jgi:thymidylate kinase